VGIKESDSERVLDISGNTTVDASCNVELVSTDPSPMLEIVVSEDSDSVITDEGNRGRMLKGRLVGEGDVEKSVVGSMST